MQIKNDRMYFTHVRINQFMVNRTRRLCRKKVNQVNCLERTQPRNDVQTDNQVEDTSREEALNDIISSTSVKTAQRTNENDIPSNTSESRDGEWRQDINDFSDPPPPSSGLESIFS